MKLNDSMSLWLNRHFSSISGHCLGLSTSFLKCSYLTKWSYPNVYYTFICKFDSKLEVRIRTLRQLVHSCFVGTH